MNQVLHIESLKLHYKQKPILTEVSMQWQQGENYFLLGRNGSGKSSLMRVLAGLQQPGYVSLKLNDADIKPKELDNTLLCYLPQHNFLPKFLTVEKVFRWYQLSFTAFVGHFPAMEQLKKLPLRSLSGGQRRLVEVYATIMKPAAFTMLDEPFTNLEPLQVEKIKEIIAAQKERCFIITDHKYYDVLDVARQGYLIRNGLSIRILEKMGLINFGYIVK
ncbi:MAG: ATP-binding cassette domain-containing protein [Edaphocola sp.]